jgi:hypothetical protein
LLRTIKPTLKGAPFYNAFLRRNLFGDEFDPDSLYQDLCERGIVNSFQPCKQCVKLDTPEISLWQGGPSMSYNTQREPYEITNEELKSFGVEVVSPSMDPLMLECLKCDQRFTVLRFADRTLPKRWWICPNGCNQQDAG